ncbi:MAG TPA: DNA-directed RNA polymerase subunit alpha C-terminal domain-containing protein [Phycisphaerae bacterium]|nr:DNA-directed RNA polymerase subunit alpha C-terminal domain-containing protein [Phycisphaerae bacterium]HRR86211.1 DNA-directed RNA polymerase subunit alpha C-terminal domain-containing protein [Phycisphaerae bacterium]
MMDNVLALIREKRLDEAEAELSRLQPGDANYHCARGLLLKAKGMTQEAIDSLEAACRMDASSLEAVFHAARIQDLYGDDEAAIENYRKLVERPTVPVNVLLNLAVLLEDHDEYEEALKLVERVLREYPNHARARLFRKDIKSSMNMLYDETQEQSREHQSALLETPITDFELSVRSRNCLKKMNINTIGDLLRITEAELLSYKNFGETSLEEIRAMLQQKNLRIGMLREESQKATRSMPQRQSPPQGSPDALNKPLSEIEFSGRSRKCLQRLGLVTLGDLTLKTEAELLATKNFGQTSLNEVKHKLAEFGLSLRK